MRQTLIEIIDHLAVGNLENVRVTGSPKGEVVLDAIDGDKTTIVQGRLKDSYKEFAGEFGIGRFSILKGWLNFSNFKTDDAEIKVINKSQGSEEIPEEMLFSNAQTGNVSTFRFLNSGILPNKAVFKGTNWDITLTPTATKIQEFAALSSILSTTVERFTASTHNHELFFNFGDSGDKASMVFSSDVTGVLKKDWSWPVNNVLQIFKLANASDLKVKIGDAGVMEIDISTKLADWSYILPARLK